MAGEVAIKQMNFLPVTLFQTLPILVSGEAIKKVQPPVQRTTADLRLAAVKHPSIHKPRVEEEAGPFCSLLLQFH